MTAAWPARDHVFHRRLIIDVHYVLVVRASQTRLSLRSRDHVIMQVIGNAHLNEPRIHDFFKRHLSGPEIQLHPYWLIAAPVPILVIVLLVLIFLCKRKRTFSNNGEAEVES